MQQQKCAFGFSTAYGSFGRHGLHLAFYYLKHCLKGARARTHTHTDTEKERMNKSWFNSLFYIPSSRAGSGCSQEPRTPFWSPTKWLDSQYLNCHLLPPKYTLAESWVRSSIVGTQMRHSDIGCSGPRLLDLVVASNAWCLASHLSW